MFADLFHLIALTNGATANKASHNRDVIIFTTASLGQGNNYNNNNVVYTKERKSKKRVYGSLVAVPLKYHYILFHFIEAHKSISICYRKVYVAKSKQYLADL